MLLTTLVLITLTVLSILLIKANTTNPQVLPDNPQPEYINTSVSIIKTKLILC